MLNAVLPHSRRVDGWVVAAGVPRLRQHAGSCIFRRGSGGGRWQHAALQSVLPRLLSCPSCHVF
jgi:hypothetical protein